MSVSLPRRYAVVLPVKPPARGKSRLVGISDEARHDLAAAFALDTVSACLGAERVGAVLVATDDAQFSAALSAIGAPCIPDGAASDLNETLRQTVAEGRRRWPSLAPVALCADLPSLLAADLDAALAQLDALEGRPAFVTDAAGVGTTMYAARFDLFAPRYGGPSRAAHLDAGAVEIEGRPTLRRDVDDLPDLQAATALGVGAHTRAVLDGLGLF